MCLKIVSERLLWFAANVLQLAKGKGTLWVFQSSLEITQSLIPRANATSGPSPIQHGMALTVLVLRNIQLLQEAVEAIY